MAKAVHSTLFLLVVLTVLSTAELVQHQSSSWSRTMVTSQPEWPALPTEWTRTAECKDHTLKVGKKAADECVRFEDDLDRPLCTSCVVPVADSTLSISADAADGQFRHWLPQWSVADTEDLSVVFSVRGSGEAFVLLSQYRNETVKDGTRVAFGLFDNRYVGFRDGADDAEWEVNPMMPLFGGLVLSDTEFRTFWINWKNGELTVGYGSHVYRNMLISTRLDALSPGNKWAPVNKCNLVRHFQHVSFGGWGKAVEFKDIKVGKAILPRTSADAPVFAVGFDVDMSYRYFNQPNMLTLSARAFAVVVEVQSLGDASIGFLKSHRYDMANQDPDAYEIVLHQAHDHLHKGDAVQPRSLIRRAIGNGRGPVYVSVPSSLDKPTVSPTEFRPFWIQLADGKLSVGSGLALGHNVLMSADVHPFPQRTLVMGFGGDFVPSAFRVLAAMSVAPEDKINVNFQAKEMIDGYQADSSSAAPLSFTTGTPKQWVHPVPRSLHATCNKFYDKCHVPQYENVVRVAGASPRVQWRTQGGYCMETSIQIAAMSRGMYVSADAVRRLTKKSVDDRNYGDAEYGFEVNTDNIMPTLKQLGLVVEEWHWREYRQSTKTRRNAPKRVHAYKRWIKAHALRGVPVTLYVKKPCSKMFDHAQLIAGYATNHDLDDPDAYDSDSIILFDSLQSFDQHYRQMNTLFDSTTSDERDCSNSDRTYCLDEHIQAGYAILGIVDPKAATIPTHVAVNDGGFEPELPFDMPITATVTVAGPLTVGSRYTIFRYDGIDQLPSNSDFLTAGSHSSAVSFEATSERNYVWVDPRAFSSRGTVYYITVQGHLSEGEPKEDAPPVLEQDQEEPLELV